MEEVGITFKEYMELRCKKNKKGNYYWSIGNKEKLSWELIPARKVG